jgi:GT2 family glycosyltransferase
LAYEYAVALRGTRLGRLVRPVFDSERRVAEVERHGDDGDERDRHADTLWATCWLLRRSDVARHGLFDEAFSMYDEDLDFCRRLSARGGVALYCPSLSVVHVGGVSSSLPERREMLRRARRRYYDRHAGPAVAAAYVAGLRLIAVADRAAAAVPSPRRRRAEAPS